MRRIRLLLIRCLLMRRREPSSLSGRIKSQDRMAFYPWPIIGGEVVEAMQVVFESKGIPHEWKETVVALIPKSLIIGPQLLQADQFVYHLYKVCVRIVVGRLKLVITAQSAYSKELLLVADASLIMSYLLRSSCMICSIPSLLELDDNQTGYGVGLQSDKLAGSL